MEKYNVRAIICFSIGYSLSATYMLFNIGLGAKNVKLPVTGIAHILVIILCGIIGAFISIKIMPDAIEKKQP